MDILDLDIYNFPSEFDFHNDQFPPLDALTYWHFLKGAKKVIEVGCGYSTYLAYKSKISVKAIDPCPRITYEGISYINDLVQNVNDSIFIELEENDILFIDSSHIYSLGSDVQYLLETILPKLKKGVIVHFHDYFGKFNYPTSWMQHNEMKHWNENEYLISIEAKHEVLAYNYLISHLHNEELINRYTFVPNNITRNLGAVRGASLWIKM